MSVLLMIPFAVLGLVALAAMAATVRRYGASIAGLRRALDAPVETRAVRVTVIDVFLVVIRAHRGPQRHRDRTAWAPRRLPQRPGGRLAA